MATLTYDDFLQWSVDSLVQFLRQRDISTTGKNKVQLVALAYSSVELNLPIKVSNEEQERKLKFDYDSQLSELKLKDPKLASSENKNFDVKAWPRTNLDHIIRYIVSKKERVGKYKRVKALHYFDGGFVGEISSSTDFCEPGKIVIFCSVTRGQAVSESRDLWILCAIDGEIFGSWCACKAGTSQLCNHVIATLYKVEYGNRLGYTNPSCTSMPSQWNRSTKRDVLPRRISEVVPRKKSIFTEPEDGASTSREEARSAALRAFDPRKPPHRKIGDGEVSSLINKLHATIPNAVLFKSIPHHGEKASYSSFQMKDIALEVLRDCRGKDDNAKESRFLERMVFGDIARRQIEIDTRGQAQSTAWKDVRKGRLTASIHHDVFTKVNTISRCTSAIKPKTTPMVSNILNGSADLASIPAVKWGTKNEAKAVKAFAEKFLPGHQNGELLDCGIMLEAARSYIGATPDKILKCSCHGISVIEIKCPWSLRTSTISDKTDVVDFLDLDCMGSVILKSSHKYYTQIISQIQLAGCNQGYFVVWTPKECISLPISPDPSHFQKVSINLEVFFKSYLVPILLNFRQLYYCGRCSKVLLNSEELADNEQHLTQICCDECGRWYHCTCEGVVPDIDIDGEWKCRLCI